VAGGALQVHPEEDLRDVLGRLHGGDHAGVDGTAPEDAAGEALGLGVGVDQLRDKLVVRQIAGEGGVEPAGDLLAPAVDVAGAAIVVAEKVVPEAQPVLGVGLVVGEQALHQPLAPVGGGIVQEVRESLGRRRETDGVEPRPPGEGAIVDDGRPGRAVRAEVAIDPPIQRGMLPAPGCLGRANVARTQIGRLHADENSPSPAKAGLDRSRRGRAQPVQR
jgi:hypothetical protein